MKSLQLAAAYSVAEIRAVHHDVRTKLEIILLPSRKRYLWFPASTLEDDGDEVLAPSGSTVCRCCSDSGRWIVWEVEASGGEEGGVSDHGALTGLLDDDHPQYTTVAEATAIAQAEAAEELDDHEAAADPHPQYILADGTRPFTGPQSMGSEKLTDVGAPTNPNDAARLVDVTDRRTDWGDILLLTD